MTAEAPGPLVPILEANVAKARLVVEAVRRRLIEPSRKEEIEVLAYKWRRAVADLRHWERWLEKERQKT